jgi:hypothetical protein
MSFRDTKRLHEDTDINKEERKPVRNLPEAGHFKELEAGAGSKTFKMDRRGIWLGDREIASAPFSVDMDGLFTLLSKLGDGAIGMSADQGLWIGAEEFDDAPFSVDMDGNIKIRASSVTEDTSISFYDSSGNLSIYIGFEDIT